MINQERRAYLEHIGYTVDLLDASRATGKAARELARFDFLTVRVSPTHSIIYARLPIGEEGLDEFAHEIGHVIQNIGRDYGTSIFKERELMPYTIGYIWRELSQ